MAQVADNFDCASFKQNIAEHVTSEVIREAVYELLKFACYNADKIVGGQAVNGSFHYQIDIGPRTKTLFTCNTEKVSVSLCNFDKIRRVAGRDIARLRRTIANIPCDSTERGPRGFESFTNDYDDRPGFLIRGTIDNPATMDKFKKAIVAFQKSID